MKSLLFSTPLVTSDSSKNISETAKKLSSPSPNKQTPPSETEEVKKVVDEFEALHRIKDDASIAKMLEMFTPPATEEEQQFYDFLTFKDIPETKGFRLNSTATFSYQLLSHEITDTQKIDLGYRVKVKEERKTLSHGDPKSDFPESEMVHNYQKKIFILVKKEGKWLIDQYY